MRICFIVYVGFISPVSGAFHEFLTQNPKNSEFSAKGPLVIELIQGLFS